MAFNKMILKFIRPSLWSIEVAMNATGWTNEWIMKERRKERIYFE